MNDRHGHITPNDNGFKANCGGPAKCRECQREAAIKLGWVDPAGTDGGGGVTITVNALDASGFDRLLSSRAHHLFTAPPPPLAAGWKSSRTAVPQKDVAVLGFWPPAPGKPVQPHDFAVAVWSGGWWCPDVEDIDFSPSFWHPLPPPPVQP